MAPSPPERLRAVRRFEDLIRYLEEELDWPLGEHAFEDLTFEYEPKELGLKDETIAEGTKIRQLRPLKTGQPWGIFFVEFPKKRLPVLVLRRILQNLVIKKRASAQKSKAAAWDAKDLLFISAFGDEAGGEREIAFGHFHEENGDKPVLRVLDWDGSDTPLKLARLDDTLKRKLMWPQQGETADAWRMRWSSAFRLRLNHVIKTSDRMADILASFARGIRQKVLAGLAAETDSGPLHVLLEDFRKSLLHDLKEADFADTYAQTVTYGLLSLAITKTQAGQPKTVTAGHLVSEVPLTSPFLKEILGELLKRGGRKGGLDYDELGLHEVVEFLNSDETDLPAILADFGNKTAADDPVIHFYEHFLTAYDKKLKIQRGVFYTPRPVVSYIVRSVHAILQTEFGLVDGLADTATWGWVAKRHPGLAIPNGMKTSDRFVTILDPATGTATFLVEVIDVIYHTLSKKWQAEGHTPKKCNELWNDYVPEHLLPRLYGYELLMAPYAIAHLKIGLKLAETGYTFGTPAVARVFLTNALEPASERKLVGLGLMALAHEAEAVSAVKRDQQFTVVVGNPPYSKLSANLSLDARRLVEPYKYVAGERVKEKGALQLEMNLQDDYVKFIRLAEATIRRVGVGVVGMITNSGYLGNPTLRGMRWSLRDAFSQVAVLDLKGSQTPQKGQPPGPEDKNVFDIKQGVAIGLFRRPFQPGELPTVTHRELAGSREAKYKFLLNTACAHSLAVPAEAPLFKFGPTDSARGSEFSTMASLPDIFPRNSAGFITSRDGLVIDVDRSELAKRVRKFSGDSRADQTVYSEFGFKPSKRLDLRAAQRVIARDADLNASIQPCLYRPFDSRFVYYKRELIESFKPIATEMLLTGNVAIAATRQVTGTRFGHVFAASAMIEIKACSHDRNTQIFPLFVAPHPGETPGLFSGPTQVANIALGALRAVSSSTGLSFSSPAGHGRADSFDARGFQAYVYSVLHSGRYRDRYAEFLRAEFPRCPLTPSRELFHALAGVGAELISLHLLQSPRLLNLITQERNATGGAIERVGWSANTVWLDAPPSRKGEVRRPGSRGFAGVSEEVWNFSIGGYQVCEKWLKDRRNHTLSVAEAAHYQKVVVAISETIRLMQEIDKLIDSYGGWPGAFQARKAEDDKAVFRPPGRVELPKPAERYVTCLPLVALKIAAGAFGDPQHIEDDDFEWVTVDPRRGLRRGMFVAQVVGKSMEPAIPDGAFCLFAAPVEGTRQGKTVLVQLRDKKDPETGERYTVKRYESEKVPDEESWRHARITLKPANRDFAAIELTGGEGDLTVIAEFIEVLGKPNATDRG